LRKAVSLVAGIGDPGSPGVTSAVSLVAGIDDPAPPGVTSAVSLVAGIGDPGSGITDAGYKAPICATIAGLR
jgi:hypothetical protein